MAIQTEGGFSAAVELSLRVGDEKLRVAQVGPNSFVLRDQRELPPGTEGTLTITVDGQATEYHVLLHRGAIIGAREVEYI